MATINIYQQYFAADCTYNGVGRRGASVMLIATSEEGRIRYEVAVSFFPHTTEDDFAVSYDAYLSKVVYDAPGRRSKKREMAIMEEVSAIADLLATKIQGTIDWEHPLSTPRTE